MLTLLSKATINFSRPIRNVNVTRRAIISPALVYSLSY